MKMKDVMKIVFEGLGVPLAVQTAPVAPAITPPAAPMDLDDIKNQKALKDLERQEIITNQAKKEAEARIAEANNKKAKAAQEMAKRKALDAQTQQAAEAQQQAAQAQAQPAAGTTVPVAAPPVQASVKTSRMKKTC